MLSTILSCTTYGINAYIVKVETHIESASFGYFNIVGLPDTSVKESKDRVVSAIKNCGFSLPIRRIVVNLAPADIKKEGSGFDLPIALGIIAAQNEELLERIKDYVFVGELSLDGKLRPVKGALSMAIEAKNQNVKGIILPVSNAREAGIVKGLNVYPMENFNNVIDFLNNQINISPIEINVEEIFKSDSKYNLDFADVKGQENVKRSLEVAAAGAHNVIMIGPPGSGKTMLAKRIPSILPPLTFEEAIETTKIHSIAGLLPHNSTVLTTRPFRSPHHTISDAALVGGGQVPRPGEISLAHFGVLFLDELPEFARNVLEVLRQPLEDSHVTVSRSKLSIDYPANFMLVCAMNPCPCGNYGNPNQECTCTNQQIQKYISKISGPLMDRIDIHIEVASVKYKELSDKRHGEPSSMIRERVIKAREIQRKRFENYKSVFTNADMQSKEIREFCKLDDKCEILLNNAMTKLGLSARAYSRILKVSRTIADLDSSDNIRADHISEAIQYRSLDKNIWLS
ncbi:MAG TPA: YifB family Mg chelatase-like AAA ATPase [Bacteroidota bacterium]|nr:YifB family Mg chelatase-like AAA ATPase [Bacteroidota bacterium]